MAKLVELQKQVEYYQGVVEEYKHMLETQAAEIERLHAAALARPADGGGRGERGC